MNSPRVSRRVRGVRTPVAAAGLAAILGATAGCGQAERPAEGYIGVEGGREADADSLILGLPDSILMAIAQHEAAGTTDAPEYAAATEAYYQRHLRRMPPANPADADSGREAFSTVVYEHMWGPSEFTSTGTLKHFDATAWLRVVRVPTLFMAGEFDEATPQSTRRFSQLVPGAEFVVIPGSGHATQNDNLEAVLSALRDFLARADAR